MTEALPHALAARLILQRVWDAETAHHSVLPLHAEDPVSRGQCEVSSVWFARYAAAMGARALVVEGVAVFGGGQRESYVWAELESGGEPYVVDLASDQFKTSTVRQYT